MHIIYGPIGFLVALVVTVIAALMSKDCFDTAANAADNRDAIFNTGLGFILALVTAILVCILSGIAAAMAQQMGIS